MAPLTSGIKVLSANCQGLQSYEKRIDVLTYLKETNASIVCLPDTHLTEKDLTSIKSVWPECYINGYKSNSRGVLILLNNNFEHEVKEINKDIEGNLLQLVIHCNSFTVNIINIYAPNHDNPQFFNQVMQYCQNDNADYNVLCGDLNLVLDPNIDSQNYLHINNPKSRSEMLKIIDDDNLVDIYRYFNPDKKRFTWRRRNPVKQARLDYFLVSNSMVDIIDSCKINSSYRSDHSIIEMNITLSKFKCGKGIWKFNNSLLKNKEYLDLVHTLIQDEKYKYALPVYNLNYIKNNHNLTFTVDDDTFLEMLLLRIRGESIKFSSRLKKQQQTAELNLKADIEKLEASEVYKNCSDLLDEKKIELESLRAKKVEGYITRSRMQWLMEGERPTTYFCGLEKKNYVEKTIRKVQNHEGKILTNQIEILAEISHFYAKLFGKPDKSNQQVDLINLLQCDKHKSIDAEDLEKKLT